MVETAREREAQAELLFPTHPLGPTVVLFRTATVATTRGLLLEHRPERIGWEVMNRSVNNGAIGFDDVFTFANGILVGAGGGTASMDWREDGEAVTDPVFAINEAASGTWRVVEIVRFARFRRR